MTYGMSFAVHPFRLAASAAFLLTALSTGALRAEEQVDFEKQIKPILERACVKCHGPEKTEGGYALHTRELMIQGGDSGEALVPGSAEDSHLFYRITLPHDDPTIMPAEGDPLKEEEVELIRKWIDAEAAWPEQLVLNIPGSMQAPKLTPEDLGVEITEAETKAVEQVEKMQALAMRIAQNTNWLRVDFSLGSKEIKAQDLAVLGEMNNLYELDLGGTSVSDDALAQLKDLKNLKRLHLENTQVSDAGLAHLSGLSKLEYLNLYGTSVTDAGLEHLKPLKNLKKLYLWQTKVTDKGAENLQAALPEVDVNLGAELTVIAQVEPAEGGEEEKKEEEKKEDEKKDAEAKKKDAKEEAAKKKDAAKKDEEKKEEKKNDEPAKDEKKEAEEQPEAKKDAPEKEGADKDKEQTAAEAKQDQASDDSTPEKPDGKDKDDPETGDKDDPSSADKDSDPAAAKDENQT